MKSFILSASILAFFVGLSSCEKHEWDKTKQLFESHDAHGHDDHSGHGHDEHAEKGHDDHSGHDHDAHTEKGHNDKEQATEVHSDKEHDHSDHSAHPAH